MFTGSDVIALRQKTGAGVLDCKKALTETDGDMEKAVDYLLIVSAVITSTSFGRKTGSVTRSSIRSISPLDRYITSVIRLPCVKTSCRMYGIIR